MTETYIYTDGKFRLDLRRYVDFNRPEILEFTLGGETVKNWHMLPCLTGLMDAGGELITWDRKATEKFLNEIRVNAIEEMNGIQGLQQVAKKTSAKWSWQKREKSPNRWIDMKEVLQIYRPGEIFADPNSAWEAIAQDKNLGNMEALIELHKHKDLRNAIDTVRGV